MKKLLISLFAIIFIVGCTTTTTPACEQDHTFSMEFTNGSNNPYDLYINGNFEQIMEAKTKVTYDIPAGYWDAEVVQRSGFNPDQIIRDYNNTYESCTDYYIVF